MKGEKRTCTICNKDVEIVSETSHDDYDDQIMSCGHQSKRKPRASEESISLTEMVQSKVIEVRTIAQEGVPVLVSGPSGISKVASFSGFQGMINNTGQMVIDKLIINYSSRHRANF